MQKLYTLKLKNGIEADVLQYVKLNDNEQLVLAYCDRFAHPYVTWKYFVNDNACEYGHYFESLDEAHEDFYYRVKNHIGYEQSKYYVGF